MVRCSDVMRMLSMFGLLAVLGMCYLRAREQAGREQGIPPPIPTQAPPSPAAAGDPHYPADLASAASDGPTAGPTDEDPEQRRDAEEEFQAVTDGTLGVQPEDMFAYWRLFLWVRHQPYETLRKRAQAGAVYADLVQAPAQYRGQLLQLDLNIRRVLSYPVQDSPIGVQRVFEIWGYSDESRGWLYDVLTPELPPGMPTGPDVHERASFAGYFFKLQGYHEAGAKPRASPLRAPLLVGRILWQPTPGRAAAADDRVWAVAIAAALAILFAGIVLRSWRQQRSLGDRRSASQETRKQAVAEWLQRECAAGGEIPEGISPSGRSDADHDPRGARSGEAASSSGGRHGRSRHEHRT